MKTLRRVNGVLANIGLTGLSLLLAYGAAEWLFLHGHTTLFSLNDLGRKFENYAGVHPLLQSSKKSFYPVNYIAITGDSYAAGLGDDAFSSPGRLRPRNHSTHVIQDMTGKDVISYGMPGSGNIRGMISNPLAAEKYIRELINKKFPAPDWLLIYFYEGNDLTENWIFYQKTFLPNHPDLDYEQPMDFDKYVVETALGRDHLYLSASQSTFQDRLFLWRYIRRLYIENIKNKKFYTRKYKEEIKLEYAPEYKWVNRFPEKPINRAIIQNKVLPMADNMQGPSMDLTEEQLQHAANTFGQALRFTKKKYPHTRIAVVYIPSVLSTYVTEGEQLHVQNFFSDDKQLFSRQELEQRSRWTQENIRQLTLAQEVIFINTTIDLQRAASQHFIHGPRDWNHLNLKGYQALGESVVRQMNPYWNTAHEQ